MVGVSLTDLKKISSEEDFIRENDLLDKVVVELATFTTSQVLYQTM